MRMRMRASFTKITLSKSHANTLSKLLADAGCLIYPTPVLKIRSKMYMPFDDLIAA